jgi:hypothetical protein
MNDRNTQPTTVDQQIHLELAKITQTLVVIGKGLAALNVTVQSVVSKMH